MRLLCLSDIHGHVKTIPVLLDSERGNGFDCIIVCGDLTQFGDYSEARNVMKPLLESNVSIFAVHGNMDLDGVSRYLEETGVSIHGRAVLYDGVSMIGLGGGNISPFNTPTEYSEDEMSRILSKTISPGANHTVKILVSHVPPYGTRLDKLGNGKHVGSQVVKDFIANEKIALCISGHIHESAGIETIGTCACVNAGAFKDGNYSIIDLDPNTGESSIDLRKVDETWLKK